MTPSCPSILNQLKMPCNDVATYTYSAKTKIYYNAIYGRHTELLSNKQIILYRDMEILHLLA